MMQQQEEHIDPPIVPAYDVTPSGIDRLRAAGPFPCRRCGQESLELPGVCDPCADNLRADELLRRLAPARDSIPEGFRCMRFGSPELSLACVVPARIDAAKLMAEAIMARKEHLILFHGPTGTAKTSLACAILNHIIDSNPSWGAGSRFVFAPMISRAYIETPRGSVPSVVQNCYQASILVIDDLGQDVVYRDTIRTLIQNRDAAREPTVITTFMTMAETADAYGGGIARRLYIDGLRTSTEPKSKVHV
jgi:hypothetical protein